ncbi:hypothetical protein LB505_005269 [Fusarium chuoi]|nr:hypothetical protein LB505_005269 [Fusarium chuoi]
MAASTGNLSLTGGPSNPSFSDDLSRFPSESLHSFSFANQSEDFLHNRQNALKRSVEFMKDHMGLPMNSSQAALASAQARVSVLARHRHHLDGQGLGQQEDPFHSSQQPMRLPTFRINQLQLLLVEVAIRARNLPQSVRR